MHCFRILAIPVQHQVDAADHRCLELPVSVAGILQHFLWISLSERLPNFEVLKCGIENGLPRSGEAVRVKTAKEIWSVKTDSNEENFGGEEISVNGNIIVSLFGIQRRVGVKRKVWREGVDKSLKLLVECENVRVMILNPHSLEEMDDFSNKVCQAVAKDNEGHPSRIGKRNCG